jgi:hypothetical protein
MPGRQMKLELFDRSAATFSLSAIVLISLLVFLVFVFFVFQCSSQRCAPIQGITAPVDPVQSSNLKNYWTTGLGVQNGLTGLSGLAIHHGTSENAAGSLLPLRARKT